MDDEEELHTTVHGTCPEFGAIFMSNNATKKECLRRRLFGLPSSHFRFVEQVKPGMILFLFEFERRQLHGVFQACSDGAMNILLHAFTSSGMQFPAQVKFRPLWCCHPLSKNEFLDAIRENYFSRNKFKFGLSEHQVRRLLTLFSSKRFKDEAPHRQLTRTEVASPSGYITSKNTRLVYDIDESPIRDQVLGECHAIKHHEPLISTVHQRVSYHNDGRFGTFKDVEYEADAFLNDIFKDLMGKVGRNIDAGEFATNDKVDYEWNTGISGNSRIISNDDRFAESERFERKCYEDDGFPQMVSAAIPISFQTDVNQQVYSRKHVLETRSNMDDLVWSSSPMFVIHRLLDSLIVTSTLPRDLGAHGNNYHGSSSMGFNRGHPSLQEYHTHDSFEGNVLGSSTNQSFPSLLDLDVNSDFIPLLRSDHYESSNRTSLPRHDYLDNLAVEFCNKECHEDLSHLKPSYYAKLQL